MPRSFAILCLVFAAGGCVIVQPQVTNPLPNVTRVAVVPFANHSVEPALDTVLVTNAYYAELQKTPGFEVVPISVTAKAIESFGLRMQSPRDALELARVLDVDAVVVGAITDFDPYTPPRIGWHVEWYSPNAPDFARGVPVDPHLRPELPRLRGLHGSSGDEGCSADCPVGCTSGLEPDRTAGRSQRDELGTRTGAGPRVVHRGQSPREWQRTRPGTEEYETVQRVFRPRLLRPGHPHRDSDAVRPSLHEQSAGGRHHVENALDLRADDEAVEQHPVERGDFPDDDPPFPFERTPRSTQQGIATVAVESADTVEPLFSETIEFDSKPANPLPPQPPMGMEPEALESEEWSESASVLESSDDWDGTTGELPPPANVPNVDRNAAPNPILDPPRRESGVDPRVFDEIPPLTTATLGIPATPPPFDPQEPIMAFTRVYDGRDQDLLARLRDYYELNGDERAGGWRGYLQRSEDFIRFTAHVSIVEMLTLHGGETRRRYVWKLRTRS